MADHLPQGMAVMTLFDRGVGRLHLRQMLGEATCSGQQEVAAAAGRI